MLVEQIDFRAIIEDFCEKRTLWRLDVESGRWTPSSPSKKSLAPETLWVSQKNLKYWIFPKVRGLMFMQQKRFSNCHCE
jgi:hypothetical protein